MESEFDKNTSINWTAVSAAHEQLGKLLQTNNVVPSTSSSSSYSNNSHVHPSVSLPISTSSAVITGRVPCRMSTSFRPDFIDHHHRIQRKRYRDDSLDENNDT